MPDIPAAHAIRGIHHLTAVTTNARRAVDYYTGVLGLRLVKQTVNFDDPSAYHLYFGDEIGRPGTLLTLFEWPHARPGNEGIGGTHHIAFGAQDRDALLRWKRWLLDHGYPVDGPYDRVYFTSIYTRDADGLIVEIATRGPGWTIDEAPDALGTEVKPPPVETTAGHRDEAAIADEMAPEPVTEIDAGMRLHGIHHITAIGTLQDRMEAFWTDLLGMRLVKRTLNFDNPDSPHLYWGVGDGAPGTIVTYFVYDWKTMRPARLGSGMTHHFALEVPDDDALDYWSRRLGESGQVPSPVRDREYFRSVYFRDPDGHILELATTVPGFTVDEPAESLGQSLRLPTGLEPRRAEIEAGLKPLRVDG